MNPFVDLCYGEAVKLTRGGTQRTWRKDGDGAGPSQ